MKTGDDDNDFARIKNGCDTDGERHPGDLGYVIIKEARIGEDGVVGEGFDTGAGREGGAYYISEDDMIRMSCLLRHNGKFGRTGFVEGNVTVLADTSEKELDPAIRLDGSLIRVAFSDEVGCVAVEDMYLGRRYIDLRVT